MSREEPGEDITKLKMLLAEAGYPKARIGVNEEGPYVLVMLGDPPQEVIQKAFDLAGFGPGRLRNIRPGDENLLVEHGYLDQP